MVESIKEQREVLDSLEKAADIAEAKIAQAEIRAIELEVTKLRMMMMKIMRMISKVTRKEVKEEIANLTLVRETLTDTLEKDEEKLAK